MGGLKEKNNSTTIAEKELQRQKSLNGGLKENMITELQLIIKTDAQDL